MRKQGKTQENTVDKLSENIQALNDYFLKKAQQQVNTALTIRNWLIGCYIVEYEQFGKDRADYGTKLYKEIVNRLLKKGVKSIRERHLYLCKDFYLTYPEILRTLSAKSYFPDFNVSLWSTGSRGRTSKGDLSKEDLELLINSLSFSHFVELIKEAAPVKRRFYEVQALKNTWSVRDLKRAIESSLYERTGMGEPDATLLHFNKQTIPAAEAIFRNTYLLEFLGLEEKAPFTESDLEERIINNLQLFLLELGRGFCFEHRQKRITFDNKHYRIDLVFYHRILKCHILLDLKIGEFDHADAGQMNMYLNYYRENESTEGDNTPIGIILCSGKNQALVKYATMGLPQRVFVSKYLINLPTEEDLQKVIVNS